MAGFVRTEDHPTLPAPANTHGLIHWLRTNLFASPVDAAMTLFAAALLVWFIPPLFNWLFVGAQWTGTDRTFCSTVAQGGIQPEGWSGACWAFVRAKFSQFLFGRYPASEYWRLWLTGILFLILFVPLLLPKAPYKPLNSVLFFGVFPLIAVLLLAGGAAIPFGLIGFLAFVMNMIAEFVAILVRIVSALPYFIAASFNWIVQFADPTIGISREISERLDQFSLNIAGPLFDFSNTISLYRSKTEAWIGPKSSYWLDYAASGLLVLLYLYSTRRSSQVLATVALSLLGFGLFVYLVGLDVGLPLVETQLWGGLLVTLAISFVGIAVSLPLGIILALGRRSKMPIVRALSVGFIETVRGVPLVTVLFMASVMLPLFLPPGVSFDKLLRALIGVALFASAYMAEIVRGGLQAIPKGQYEGADSLGLGYWQKMGLIVLPQALKLVIPNIVSSFISLLKDTSLVYIIGMFDLLGIVRQNFSDANWSSAQTPKSGLIFAAFVFWIICFGMSRYSQYVERRLDTSHKK
jgi:general L-amino acid transport system permease protein